MFVGIFLRITASIDRNNKCPPSKIGIGSMLRKPIFILIKAKKFINAQKPALALSPVI